MYKKILTLMALTSLILLSGCMLEEETPARDIPELVYSLNNLERTSDINIYKFIDYEEGVLCYVSIGYKKGGISCIKID